MTGRPIAQVFDDLCAALERRTGRHVDQRSGTTLCPSHDDSSPSLSVRLLGDDISVNCFAGCRQDDVLTAIGWDWTDIRKRPEDPNQHAATDTYLYTDQNGEPLFRVLKRPGRAPGKKIFWQERWDNGQWVGGSGALDGVQRVPYRLPELLAAISKGHEIYIAEGEKDVDALYRTGGVTATCNPHGASKWTDDCTRWFPPATRVNIIADDDDPGRRHAHDVAARLAEAGCDPLIYLPAAGKDPFDHLAAGLTVTQLLPDPDDERHDNEDVPHRKIGGIAFVNWPAFWATRHDDGEWLCEPVVPKGRAVHIYAKRGVGKSDLTIWLAAHLATGRPALGHPGGEPLSVVYLDYEMTEEDLYDRLTEMGFDGDTEMDSFYYSLLPSIPKLNTEQGGIDAQHLVNETGADVVFIDSITRVIAGKENDQETFDELLRHTINPLKKRGVTTVWTGNSGKDAEKGSRGSIGKEDVLDCIWELSRTDAGAKLKNTKKRAPWIPEDVSMKRIDDGGALRYEVIPEDWPIGTMEAYRALEAIGAPVDVTRREAQRLLKEAGRGMRAEAVAGGIRYRRHWATKGRGISDEF